MKEGFVHKLRPPERGRGFVHIITAKLNQYDTGYVKYKVVYTVSLPGPDFELGEFEACRVQVNVSSL